MDGSERVYTLQEAAERLHMPYRSLRDAVYDDRWPHRYISPRRRLMTEGDIAAVLEMTSRQPAPTASPHPFEERRARANIKRLIHA